MRAPRIIPGAVACAVLVLGACATSPPAPTDALASAQAALTQAEQARVGDESAVELREAREKLQLARTTSMSSEEHDMIQARKLAEEARVEAELASAKSATERQRLANAEVRKTIDVMRFESQRNPGGDQ